MTLSVASMIACLASIMPAQGDGFIYRGPGDTVPPHHPPWLGPDDRVKGPALLERAPRARLADLGPPAAVESAHSALSVLRSALRAAELDERGLLARQGEIWQQWWTMNRAEQIGPPPWAGGAGWNVGESGLLSARQLQRMRARTAELARAALDSADAGLRRSGALALARLCPGDATDALEPLLFDMDGSVRRAALLALGSAACSASRERLLAVAREPSSALEAGFALVALGLCRSGSADLDIDFVLEDCMTVRPHAPREVLLGALMHQRLARVESLWPAVRALAAEESAPIDVRARALEALGSSHRAEDVDQLVEALRSKNRELRRSAALALGTTRNLRVAAALIAALEVERDLAACGFEAIALGRQASQEAVRHLIEWRGRARSSERPWITLSLGIAARAGNEAARAVLDLPLEPGLELNERCAAILAIGLARQEKSFGWLERGVEAPASSAQRAIAAESLGLLATAPARQLLLDRMQVERDETVHSVLGQSLARMRRVSDAELLVEVVRATSDPRLRAEALDSLARNGCASAMVALLETAALSPAAADRSRALESASAVLSAVPLERLGTLGRDANFLVFEGWMAEIVGTGN